LLRIKSISTDKLLVSAPLGELRVGNQLIIGLGLGLGLGLGMGMGMLIWIICILS
jgi:hypothetical protein